VNCVGSFEVPPVEETSFPVLEVVLETRTLLSELSSLASGGSLRSTGEPVCVDINFVSAKLL
jgi:hypothetical protein